MDIVFKVKIEIEYVMIHFELTNIISPIILRELTPPDPIEQNFAHKGVILSGKGPIWLYGFLIHYYHPTKWVATYDPRLQGAVVVETHHRAMEVGTIVPINNIKTTLKNKNNGQS